MEPAQLPLVKGEIIFDQDARSFSDARIFVRLEEVSLADSPSRVISEQVIESASYVAKSGASIKFALYGEMPDKHGRYVVSVHVDVDGDGKIGPGDYITMESYPVLTFGYPNQVDVRARWVK